MGPIPFRLAVGRRGREMTGESVLTLGPDETADIG